MKWLDIHNNHHTLSHELDNNTEVPEKLVKINIWLCEQLTYLARKFDAVSEPGGEGSMLDHRTILWINELGMGNSHSLDHIPFLLVGREQGFESEQAMKFDDVPYNPLWLRLLRAPVITLRASGARSSARMERGLWRKRMWRIC